MPKISLEELDSVSYAYNFHILVSRIPLLHGNILMGNVVKIVHVNVSFQRMYFVNIILNLEF